MRGIMGDTSLTDMVMVISFEGEVALKLGSVAVLAEMLEKRHYVDIQVEVRQLLAVGSDGRLADVAYWVDSDGYDEHDWSHQKVTIVLPDGREEFAFYRIDGRA